MCGEESAARNMEEGGADGHGSLGERRRTGAHLSAMAVYQRNGALARGSWAWAGGSGDRGRRQEVHPGLVGRLGRDR